MAAIAGKTRLSRSQAQRIVHGLIDAGYVSVTGNETGGKPGTTRQYRVNLNALTGSADATTTGRTHATGSVDATGSAHAQEGPHPCAETGRTHATQTVKEPSRNRQVNVAALRVASKPTTPVCPHQEIIAAYHEQLPGCPSVREWSNFRQRLLRSRWAESPKRQTLEWWRRFFAYVGQSEFLTGRGSSRDPDRDPFIVDLEWLIRPKNFVKVVEGKYHREIST
jgi:hypothetical protein